jgi:hypothetical protein
MSRFGQDQFKLAGIDARYVPHALEPVWQPTPLTIGGVKAREAIEIPADAFLVTIAAANAGNHPARKAWGEMLFSVAQLMRAHPDVWLYLHTDLIGAKGIELEQLLRATTGLERVRVVDQYAYRLGAVPSQDMAALYTASDVLLATSMGEGFGLPTLEAQACGCPVIVSDFSAQPELVGAGWKAAAQPYWDHAQGAYFCTPIIASIIDRLEAAYAARGDQDLRAKGIAFAADYAADKVFAEHWRPVLAEMESMLSRPVAKVGPNRAARRARRKAA